MIYGADSTSPTGSQSVSALSKHLNHRYASVTAAGRKRSSQQQTVAFGSDGAPTKTPPFVAFLTLFPLFLSISRAELYGLISLSKFFMPC